MNPDISFDSLRKILWWQNHEKFLHWTKSFFRSTATMDLPCPLNDFLLRVYISFQFKLCQTLCQMRKIVECLQIECWPLKKLRIPDSYHAKTLKIHTPLVRFALYFHYQAVFQ